MHASNKFVFSHQSTAQNTGFKREKSWQASTLNALMMKRNDFDTRRRKRWKNVAVKAHHTNHRGRLLCRQIYLQGYMTRCNLFFIVNYEQLAIFHFNDLAAHPTKKSRLSACQRLWLLLLHAWARRVLCDDCFPQTSSSSSFPLIRRTTRQLPVSTRWSCS